MTDTIAHGLSCSWWGEIYECDHVEFDWLPGQHIAVCPYCSGPLTQYPRAAWADQIALRAAYIPGFNGLANWSKGKCFASLVAAARACRDETGLDVVAGVLKWQMNKAKPPANQAVEGENGPH